MKLPHWLRRGTGSHSSTPTSARHEPPRRLFIDLSEVVDTDYGTGIHRVVRNMTRSLMALSQKSGWSMAPVMHKADGQLQPADAYVSNTLGIACQAPDWPPRFGQGDVLLMLDSAWEHPARFLESIRAVQAAAGQAGAFVYDLIPLRFPQYCVDFMPPIFERWLRFVVEYCDFLVCISQSVADDLASWIKESNADIGRGLRIGHVHLGSDINEAGSLAPATAATREAMHGKRSVLMVGTIEPRKRHALALDAFELAWRSGSDLRLVVMGRQGWNVQALVDRIVRHPELQRRLFWIDPATDGDLAHAYAHARTLLQASDAEGFGLPIVEAAHYATPLLLSDIPVFGEIAGTQADYFKAGDVQSLSGWLLPDAPPRRPSSAGLAITWRASAERLLTLMADSDWDHELP